MTEIKFIVYLLGGALGWMVATFAPTFPLIIVMVLFILYDAWTAYKLDKRVHIMYPDKTQRHEAKFRSFAFGKVVRKTIPERLILILLAFLAEKYVFIHVSLPLSYIATGVILMEQALSALENNASCPLNEDDSKLWVFLRRLLVDKTERHFDIDLGEYGQLSDEEVERMKKRIHDYEQQKGKKL